MNRTHLRSAPVLLPVLAFAFSAGHASAVNIAGLGTGIMGVNTSINSSTGTSYIQFGTFASLNDGNLAGGHIDTFNGSQPHAGSPASYAGIAWGAPRTDFITTVSFTNPVYFDGGWFGPNNSGPGGNSSLTAAHLIEPTVQITLDGSTWINVGATSDYVAVMTGAATPAPFTAPVAIRTSTFTLTTPATGIMGIRLIGSEGGTASGGFLAATEIGVNAEIVPEPGSMGLAGFAAAMLLRRRRRA